VLKGTMDKVGRLSSTDTSYYKLTALNWELNQQWKKDPAKVAVSYADDIAQGNVEARPIVDKIIYGMTDQTMYSQGTVSHFMQAITTTMAVDISKTDTFTSNQDDIRYTIDSQRSSVSGVDENEEAADLTKFQNLYNLASKVISVLNEVYDKLINQTGV
ncbi:MAG: flagellar hook-associated protein FlgK, partial [Lachnospiraceae bacterium]|nr:flagellar hook-associated protein FlgK [Lachnospiraceae bacterium]